MTDNNTATHYAAVRTVATALLHWRNGDMAKVNSIVAHMPVSVFVAASLTLNEAAYANLADVTRRDFDGLVEAVVAEMIGLESEDRDDN